MKETKDNSEIEFITKRSKFSIHTLSIGYKFTVEAEVDKECIGAGSIIYSKTRIPMFIDYDVLEKYRRRGIATRITRLLVTVPNIVKSHERVFVLYDPEAREFWTSQLPFLYTQFKRIIFKEFDYTNYVMGYWHEINNMNENQMGYWPVFAPIDDPMFY